MAKNDSNSRQRTARKAPKVISTRTAFRGKVFLVTQDEVIEPSGARVRRDTVRHSGSVVIMAIDRSGREPRVLLVRQYRYPVDSFLWELPAGRVDEGENPLAAAKRELIEETGYRAKKWKKALTFYSSPGFLDERMWLYLAEDLERGEAQPEEDEFISKRFVPLSAALKQVQKGGIQDAKTIVGVLWLKTVEPRQSHT
jgi:ADP-ribose pyrophosphatase